MSLPLVRGLVRGLARALAWALPLAAGVLWPLVVQAQSPAESLVARMVEPATADDGRRELLAWVRDLPPGQAAPWLRLGASLDGLEAAGVRAASQAVLMVHGDSTRAREAGRVLRDFALERPDGEQALLLALAATLVEEVDPDEALALRRRHLALDAGGPEAAEVAVAVAQALLQGTGDEGPEAGPEAPAAEALRILETLLERSPMDPMAPEARRLRTVALGRLG